MSNGDTAGSTGLGGLGEAPYANLTQLHKAQMGGGGNFSIQNEAEFPALPGASEARGSEDGQPGAPGPQQAGQQQQVCTCHARRAEMCAWQCTQGRQRRPCWAQMTALPSRPSREVQRVPEVLFRCKLCQMVLGVLLIQQHDIAAVMTGTCRGTVSWEAAWAASRG